MRIAIGCDHAAYEMKDIVAAFLESAGVEVADMGTHGPASVDYPDFASRVCEAVIEGHADRGILICGTGLGMSMAANKHAGIRAALCSEPFTAKMSRLHNNANVLCMGARVIGPSMAEEITRVWIDTPFEGGRHQKRLDKIITIESITGKNK